MLLFTKKGAKVLLDLDLRCNMAKDNAKRAIYLYKNLRTHRVALGLTFSELAQKCGVSRTTLTKMEKKEGLTQEICMKVFNLVNQNTGNKYDAAAEITKRGAYGR